MHYIAYLFVVKKNNAYFIFSVKSQDKVIPVAGNFHFLLLLVVLAFV